MEIPTPEWKKPKGEKSEDEVEWKAEGKEKKIIPHTEHVKAGYSKITDDDSLS